MPSPSRHHAPHPTARRMLHPLSILLLVLVTASSALADAGAAGEIVGNDATIADDPDALRESVLEHRFEEAARKEALVKGLIAAEAEKTFNQEQYDVRHYDLDLDLNPDTRILSGTVVTTLTVIGEAIVIVQLDLANDMTVTEATVNGTPTTFIRGGGRVTVDLDRSYDPGETLTVGVTYQGNPAGGSFGWDSHNGQDMIWTLSEPFGARDWWPCKDFNTDKADSVDIRVTVPDNLIVASQGELISDVDNGATRTFTWKSRYPINTYLVSLAIYPYSQYSDWYTPQGGGDPMEVAFYVYPDHLDDVAANYALTVPMIDVFAQGYGEYPFVDEKYGHAEFEWGGGMEHQTISSMGGWSEDLISHELAHMWWGDMITCDDFGHIWLNEGFATWSEAYWKEQTEGFATYQQYMNFAAYYGGGTIFVENPQSDNIFDGNLSYNKGSWVVHMLRGVVGDADFFTGLAQYRANHEYGTATTEELRDAMEAVSGRDLDAFFEQWIYGDYFPVYRYSYTEGPGAGQITVTIEQVQTQGGLFTMPIQLRVTSDQGTYDFTVENSAASEEYVLDVPGPVQGVLLDPDGWILRRVETTVSNPSFTDGILLVNGVHWQTYGAEITSAYADSAFTGNQPFDFWDCFSAPPGGYVSELPTPLGTGGVPPTEIGRYSTVIWVGNNYSGDLASWFETPIQSYLNVGGNLVLLTRRSLSFLEGSLTSYLGVTWAEQFADLANCVAVPSDLVSIPFTGTQSWNDVFMPQVGPNSTLLFLDTSGFNGSRGTGVWAVPPEGGTDRPEGGHLVHIAGRPYRMQHTALRQNIETILTDYLGEPWVPTAAPGDDAGDLPTRATLAQNYPNPFNPQTVIPFALPRAMRVELAIHDARGRLVTRLIDAELPAGPHQVRWDGTDNAGLPVSSGTYFARLVTADGETTTRGLVLVR